MTKHIAEIYQILRENREIPRQMAKLSVIYFHSFPTCELFDYERLMSVNANLWTIHMFPGHWQITLLTEHV